MFGTYIYPWIVTIVVDLFILWLAAFLARRYFFNRKVKCVQTSLNGKKKHLKGTIVGDVTELDDTLFFNGRDAFLNCGMQKLSLPIKVSLDFNIGKKNESWATLLGWNQVIKPNNGLQIAIANNKLVCRIGDRIGGDIYSDQEVENDNEFHHIEISRVGNKIVLALDGVRVEKQANDEGLNNKKNKLTVGKSFLEEYFNGTIKNIKIERP